MAPVRPGLRTGPPHRSPFRLRGDRQFPPSPSSADPRPIPIQALTDSWYIYLTMKGLCRTVAALGFLLPALATLPVVRASPLQITEFMAINERGFGDANTNFPDWIELLYNAPDRFTSTTNLAGWHLTDDPDELTKWTFPATNAYTTKYLVVFASNKDATIAGQLHTNFKLSGDRGYLALVEPDGVTIASEITYGQQYADASYGYSSSPTGTLVYFDTPTPGTANNTGRVAYGPLIQNVAHNPPEPGDAQNLAITARITYPVSNVATAMLHYIAMWGTQTNAFLYDDGAHGDGAAGDSVYGGTIPHSAYSPNHMIRYAISARGGDNSLTRAPDFSDPADYFGTVCYDPALATNPPVLHWFTPSNGFENYLVTIANWYTWTSDPNAWSYACLYYRGQFYSGCQVRKKGSSTINVPYHKYKVVLPPGHPFTYDPTYPPVEEFNIHRWQNSGDGSYMREPLATDLMQAAGVPSYNTTYTTFRHNGTNETAIIVEQQDETYLARNGFAPEGALYKADPNQHPSIAPVKCSDLSLDWQNPAIFGLYNKESRGWEDQTDLNILRTNLAQTAGSDAMKRYVFDNLNIPQILNQMVVAVIVGHGDRCEKNYYVYRDSDRSREWSMFPWDFDTYIFKPGSDRGGITWVETGKAEVRSIFYGDYGNWSAPPNNRAHSWLHWDYGVSIHTGAYTNSYNRLYDAIIRTPGTREMYLRRLRTVMDKLLGPTTPGYMESRIDYFNALPPSAIIEGDLKTYASTRRAQLYTGSGGFTEYTNIPPAQTISPHLFFGALDHTPASGEPDHEYVEIINTNRVSVDISGWFVSNAVAMVFQPGTVIPARTNLFISPNVAAFRAREVSPRSNECRFVQGPYDGRLSAGGETLALYDTNRVLISSLSYTGAPLPGYSGDLRVTEVMFHPVNGEGEFIEIQNAGAATADLRALRFTTGVTFDFATSPVSSLAPGAFALVVRNLPVFQSLYTNAASLPIAGTYAGSLNNAGETLSLFDTNSAARVFEASYASSRGWPIAADGAGHSLIPLVLASQAGGRLDYGGNWRSSATIGGSPGAADPEPTRDVLLNEFMAHTDYTNDLLPMYDSNDWIELFNTRPAPAVLTNWFLSDDADNLRKWMIPTGTTIPATGFAAFDEVTGFHFPITNGFGLDKAGGYLFLSHLPGSPADRVADAVRYKGQENFVTLGRFPDGAAHWYTLIPTTNAANTAPPPHVVVSRLMYHPVPTINNPEDNTADEYIELTNAAPAAQSLWTEAGPWRIDGAVQYTFPSNTTFDAGARLQLVTFDPSNAVARSNFLAAHGFTEGDATLLGPYTSRLSNHGERLAVERPQEPDVPGAPTNWVILDEVIYFDDAPWTPGADGLGPPLVRLDHAVSGNEPTNWSTNGLATPNPDTDGDGLPDAWEEQYFLSISAPTGGPADDWDLDGVLNIEEYIAGTSPTNSDAFFAVDITNAGAAIFVSFLAIAATPEDGDVDRFYALESLPGLSASNWLGVTGYTNILGADQTVTYPHPDATNLYFYRGRVWLQ